jgi:hypothetical protein
MTLQKYLKYKNKLGGEGDVISHIENTTIETDGDTQTFTVNIPPLFGLVIKLQSRENSSVYTFTIRIDDKRPNQPRINQKITIKYEHLQNGNIRQISRINLINNNPINLAQLPTYIEQALDKFRLEGTHMKNALIHG